MTEIPRAYETVWAREAIASERDRPAGLFQYAGHDHEPSDEVVFVVDRGGVCRPVDAAIVQTEHWRVAQVKRRGEVPPGVSPDIQDAPARGPVRTFTPKSLYPKGEDQWELKPSSQVGPDGEPFKAIQRADVFDLMLRRARLAHKGQPGAFVAPFTSAQIAMGRWYRNVWERHASAGVRCSSVEALRGGSGDSGGFMDAVLRDREQLERIRVRIGDGVALEVKRRGRTSARSGITDRRLVDLVCLEDRSLADVLRAHGWAKRGGNVKVLQVALASALNRMMGPAARSSRVVRDPDLPSGFGAFAEAVAELS